MRIHRDERGQTIILVALSLPLLLGFIGLATDVGALFKLKRTLQTAADAAAIAGALNHNSANPGAWHDSAIAAATANGFTAGNGVTITPADGPTWPSSNYVGQTGYVEVTITKVESTIFLALFGHPSVTVLARAVASSIGPATNCVYTGIGTPPSGPTLTVLGPMQSLAPQCGLVVDSIASPPITVTGGSLTMKSIGTVGDCADDCGSGITPTPVPNIIPYSDPLSFLPQYTCNASSCTSGSSSLSCSNDPQVNTTSPITVLPGCYNGLTVNSSTNVTFNPGLYVINGTLTFSGSNISGTGVTFYVASLTGSLSVIGNSTLNLSAPNDKNQPFNGILFAQSSLDPTAATINGLAPSTLQGIFYFPAANITLLNVSGGPNVYTGFVVQSMTVNGSFSFNNYSAAPGVTSSPLSSAVLVE